MSLSAGNTILASDFINLKKRIKDECKRRKYNGSVSSYAGSQYDYTVLPEAGKQAFPEHYNKIIIPYNALTGSNLKQKQVGNIVTALNTISENLATLEAIPATSQSSGCKSSCTGLCQGTCASGCTGCSGTCKSSCTGTCKNGCTGCSGTCGDSCHNNCSTGCYSKCDNSCSSTCSNSCANSCEGTCQNGCLFRCKGLCTGLNDIHPIE